MRTSVRRGAMETWPLLFYAKFTVPIKEEY